MYYSLVKMISIQARYGRFVGICQVIESRQKVADKPWIITFEVTDVECGVEWPEILTDEEDLANCAISPGDNPGPLTLAFEW